MSIKDVLEKDFSGFIDLFEKQSDGNQVVSSLVRGCKDPAINLVQNIIDYYEDNPDEFTVLRKCLLHRTIVALYGLTGNPFYHLFMFEVESLLNDSETDWAQKSLERMEIEFSNVHLDDFKTALDNLRT